MQEVSDLVTNVLQERGYSFKASKEPERSFIIESSRLNDKTEIHFTSYGRPIRLKLNESYDSLYAAVRGLGNLVDPERYKAFTGDILTRIVSTSLEDDVHYEHGLYGNSPRSPVFHTRLKKKTPEKSVNDLLRTGENYVEKIRGLEARMKILAERNLSGIEAYVKKVAPEQTLQDALDTGELPG